MLLNMDTHIDARSICQEELGGHAPIATKSSVEETCGGSLEFLFHMKPCCAGPMMVPHNLLIVIILKNPFTCALITHI